MSETSAPVLCIEVSAGLPATRHARRFFACCTQASPCVGLLSILIAHADAQGASPDNDALFASIDTQIQSLGDADFAVREAAFKALLAAGKRAGPALKAAATSKDAEVAACARELLTQIFPALEMTVVRADPEVAAKAGKPIVLQIRIKNVSESTVAAVPCLDGSTSGNRYPFFQVSDASPNPGAARAGFKGCGNCNQLRSSAFVTLKPGEQFDPFATYGHGQGGFGAELCTYTPAKAGKVTLTFVCDYSAPSSSQWDGPIERSLQRLTAPEKELFQLVPKLRLEAKVEFEVRE